MAELLLINGAPGVGKTRFAEWLAPKLDMPVLGKDDLKEFLFDRLGHSNRDWSRVLGRASADMLYVLAEESLKAGQSLMIENAFWPEFAKPTLTTLKERTQAEVYEVYCFTDDETRLQRFSGRQEAGERHPGHVDNLATMRDVTQYGPLNIGAVVFLDTTVDDETQYVTALHELQEVIEKGV